MCDHHQLRSQQPSGQIAHVGSLSVTFTVPALTATRPVMQHVWPPPAALPAAESQQPSGQIAHVGSLSVTFTVPALTATRPVMQHVWPPPVALPAAEWSDRPRRQSICYLHCSSIDHHPPCHAACVTTTSCAPSSRVVRSPTLAVCRRTSERCYLTMSTAMWLSSSEVSASPHTRSYWRHARNISGVNRFVYHFCISTFVTFLYTCFRQFLNTPWNDKHLRSHHFKAYLKGGK